MIKNIKNLLLTGILALSFVGGTGLMVATSYSTPVSASAESQIRNGIKDVNDGNDTKLVDFIQTIINIILFILGAVAVIMVIYGGFRFVASGGSAESVKAAKNTILYAIVGLVVAILAFAIVNFVVDNIKG